MRLAWITGARGFIGRHLAVHLLNNGYQVAGIGHGAWVDSEVLGWGVGRWINGEIHSSNLHSLRVSTGMPDLVFHLAGGSSVGLAIAAPHEDFFRSVASTVNLMDWLRLESPKTVAVVASSAAIYGAGHSGGIPESAGGIPFSPYGYHKLMMEQVCRSYGATFGLRTTVARLFSVYGSGLKKQLLWDLCKKLSADSGSVQLGGTGDEVRDWVEIRDVIHALERLGSLATCDCPVINVGSGQPTSVREIASIVLANWPSNRRVTFSGEQRSGDPFSLVADCSQLRATGFLPQVPVDVGVAEYVRWYLRQSGHTD
jgi:UDP-glucose 4-epimerase